MRETGTALIAIFTGIIGLAIVAVIVSRNAATPQVLQAAGTAFAGIIGAAVQPVTSSGTFNVPVPSTFSNWTS